MVDSYTKLMKRNLTYKVKVKYYTVYSRGAFIFKNSKKGGRRLFEGAFKRRGRLIEVIRYVQQCFIIISQRFQVYIVGNKRVS